MEPYYEQDGITIYHGDCREVLPQLPEIGLLLTDPPYGYSWNTSYSRFSKGFTDKQPITNDTGLDLSFLLDIGEEQIIFGVNQLGLSAKGSLIVWDKRCADGFSFLSDGEAAYWSEGTGVYICSKNGQQARSQAGLHPTQKPIYLMRWCIDKSKSSGIILDPFMGSGTTLRAAMDVSRAAIGIEVEERYCEIAANRLAQKVLQFD